MQKHLDWVVEKVKNEIVYPFLDSNTCWIFDIYEECVVLIRWGINHMDS